MKKIKDKNGFIALAVFLTIFPIVWFIFDATNTPSKLGLPVNSVPGQWSVVLISYFASALSALAGFIATAYSVNKSIEHQNRVRKQDNAIAALPLISVEYSDGVVEKSRDAEIEYIRLPQEKASKEIYLKNEILKNPFLKFSLQNKGQREMYNLRFMSERPEKPEGNKKDLVLFPVIYSNEEKVIGVNLKVAIPCDKNGAKLVCSGYPEYGSESTSVEFFFEDCYGNTYSQLIELEISYSYKIYEIYNKKYKFYDDSGILECKIISAPKAYGKSDIKKEAKQLLNNWRQYDHPDIYSVSSEKELC